MHALSRQSEVCNSVELWPRPTQPDSEIVHRAELGNAQKRLSLFKGIIDSERNFVNEGNLDHAVTLADALNERAQLYMQCGRFDDAANGFGEAIEIRGKYLGLPPASDDLSANMSLLRANCIFRAKPQSISAIANYVEALQKDKNHTKVPLLLEPLNVLASLDIKNGYYQSAQSCYRNIVELTDPLKNPKHPAQYLQSWVQATCQWSAATRKKYLDTQTDYPAKLSLLYRFRNDWTSNRGDLERKRKFKAYKRVFDSSQDVADFSSVNERLSQAVKICLVRKRENAEDLAKCFYERALLNAKFGLTDSEVRVHQLTELSGDRVVPSTELQRQYGLSDAQATSVLQYAPESSERYFELAQCFAEMIPGKDGTNLRALIMRDFADQIVHEHFWHSWLTKIQAAYLVD